MGVWPRLLSHTALLNCFQDGVGKRCHHLWMTLLSVIKKRIPNKDAPLSSEWHSSLLSHWMRPWLGGKRHLHHLETSALANWCQVGLEGCRWFFVSYFLDRLFTSAPQHHLTTVSGGIQIKRIKGKVHVHVLPQFLLSPLLLPHYHFLSLILLPCFLPFSVFEWMCPDISSAM